jgi:hypothetical protein
MTQPLSSHDVMTAKRPPVRAVLLWGGVVMAAILLVAALVLWLRYGTTVFFEMIAAGFAACF